MTHRTRLVSLTLTLLVLVLAGLLAGCATSPAAPAGSQPASTVPASGTAAAPPTIQVLAPLEGSEAAGAELRVQVETSGLKFVMPSNTLVSGEGHVHLTLDDQPFKMSTTPDYAFKDVAPGPHSLKAELVQNDTKSFDPPVVQTVTFTVK